MLAVQCARITPVTLNVFHFHIPRIIPPSYYNSSAHRHQTSIGKWKQLERSSSPPPSSTAGGEHILSGDILLFEKGQRCWNGPSRSLRVSLACGPDDVLSTVAEPETCTYTAVLETPAACSPDLRDALFAEAGEGDGAAGLDVEDDVVEKEL